MISLAPRTCPRLRGHLYHALVVPSFGASQEVKRECGAPVLTCCLAGNSAAAPATVGGSPEINDVTECRRGGIGKTIEGIIRKPGDRPQDTDQLVRRWVEERKNAQQNVVCRIE
jgi:hypothetical protein